MNVSGQCGIVWFRTVVGRAVMYPTVEDEWEERDDIKPKIEIDKVNEMRKRRAARKARDERKRKRMAITKRLGRVVKA